MRFHSTVRPSTTDASGLAVFVHGWSSSSRTLSEVVTVVQETMPQLDCVLIDHEGGAFFSNERPEIIADRIAYEIARITQERADAGRPYERIILIGHSVGALLMKKAYLFASGFLDDSPAGESYAWPEKVERLISLAGVDRGVPILQKTAQTSLWTFLTRRIAYNALRYFRLARFIRSLQRGDPFVSNLRVQWLRLRTNEPPNRLPDVYHLVGDADDLIERDDSVDTLLSSKQYVYLTVVNADHQSIVRPRQNPYVRAELLAALSGKTLSLQQPAQAAPATGCASLDDAREPITDIFYVIHGIRDLGRTWTPGVCDAIRAVADADRTRKIRTVRSSYGYFSMLSFLISWDRQKNVRWFMDIYTQMVARYPKASHHYVGHSNGTYILASAIERYATCRVCNVFFAGSVVRSTFDWTKYYERKQVGFVRNDVGSADWVVALFPHLFEFVADFFSHFDVNAPKWCDLGAAGFYGFFDDRSNDNTWLPGDHGAAIKAYNHRSIAESVVFGRPSRPAPIVVEQDARLLFFSKIAWFIVPGAIAIVVGGMSILIFALLSFGYPLLALLAGAFLALIIFGTLSTI